MIHEWFFFYSCWETWNLTRGSFWEGKLGGGVHVAGQRVCGDAGWGACPGEVIGAGT
jgi:hypothetical protein